MGRVPARPADQGQAGEDRHDRDPLDQGLRQATASTPSSTTTSTRSPAATACSSARHALQYARLLDQGRPPHGLAAGQKNLAGFDGHRVGYDFAVSEECGHYDECDAYVDDFGDQVLMIEYVADDFEATCDGVRRDARRRAARPGPVAEGGAPVVLNTTELGDSGSRVVFCHGLFGQGKNFTAVRQGAGRRPPRDARRHARPRAVAADRGLRLPRRTPTWWPSSCPSDDPVALVGHSMGGKVAMLVALRHPELVERLAVVDVAPVPYDHAAEFEGYIAAMQAIDLETLSSRADADAALLDAVPDPMVRGFLLQSLRRDGRRLGVAAQPRRCSAATSTGSPAGRMTGWPTSRRTTARCCGSGARIPYVRAGARRRDGPAVPAATAGSPSRAPATGCTPSSPRCSSRCCGGSWTQSALDLLLRAR